jgi:hypothetical protein
MRTRADGAAVTRRAEPPAHAPVKTTIFWALVGEDAIGNVVQCVRTKDISGRAEQGVCQLRFA